MYEIRETPLAPTVDAIDAWRKQRDGGVNVWTKSGSCRYVISRRDHGGHVWFSTVPGEGSSIAGRETLIRADRIVRAVGWAMES